MRTLSIALFAVAVAVTSACKSPENAAPPPPPAAAPAPAPAPTPPPTPAPVAKVKAPPDLARKPLTDAEKAANKAYRVAMQKGRKATAAKDYPTAITAFGEALTAVPNDARAISERGFAQLLAKNYDAAAKDLEAARVSAVNTSLQGQIYFNLGLLAEAKGDTDAAHKAFAKSNSVRPSKAAAAKLAGKPTCAVTIDRTPVKGVTYASWAEAFRGLMAVSHDDGDDTKPPADMAEQEAKDFLCREAGACSGPGPWSVVITDDGETDYHHLIIPMPGAKLLVFANIGTGMGGRCGWSDEIKIKGGDPLQVTVISEPDDMVFVDVTGDDIKLCDGDECQTACFATEKVEHDLFFDAASGTQILAISRPWTAAGEFKIDENFKQPVRLGVAKDGLLLSGGSCDQAVPFKTK